MAYITSLVNKYYKAINVPIKALFDTADLCPLFRHESIAIVRSCEHLFFLFTIILKIFISDGHRGLSSVSIRILLTVLNYRTSHDPLYVRFEINFLL